MESVSACRLADSTRGVEFLDLLAHSLGNTIASETGRDGSAARPFGLSTFRQNAYYPRKSRIRIVKLEEAPGGRGGRQEKGDLTWILQFDDPDEHTKALQPVAPRLTCAGKPA